MCPGSVAPVPTIQPELFGDLRAHVLYVSLISAVTGARSPEAERRRLVELSRGYDDGFSGGAPPGVAGQWSTSPGMGSGSSTAARTVPSSVGCAPRTHHVDPGLFSQTRVATRGQDFEHTITVNGATVAYDFASIATLSGQPDGVSGRTDARRSADWTSGDSYLEDRTPIHFAALLEREFGGFRRPPGYDD